MLREKNTLSFDAVWMQRFGKEALMALKIEDKVKNEVLVKIYGEKHAPPPKKQTCPGLFSLLTFSLVCIFLQNRR